MQAQTLTQNKKHQSMLRRVSMQLKSLTGSAEATVQEPVARWLPQASSSLAQPNAKGQHQRGVQGNTACPSLGGLCRGKAVFLGKALLTWVWCPSSASPSCSTPYVLQLVCSTGASLSAAHPVHEQPEPTVIIGDGLQQQNDSMMRLLFFKH